MKLFFICVLFLSIGGCNQSQENNVTENDLLKLENDWMNAMMKKDSSTLDKIVAPEFTLSGAKQLDRPAVPRVTWMKNAMKNMKIDSVHFINSKVNIIDNIAIVKASFFWKGAFDKEVFADTTFLIDTWMKTKHGWQVVSRVIAE